MIPGGLILAGGRSLRFGGGHKGLAPLAGRPLLTHVIERVAPQCGPLALNLNGDAGDFTGFGLPVVPDTVAGYPGPLAGVLAGLRWLAREAPNRPLLTVTVDEPFVPRDLAPRLTAAHDVIAFARSGGRSHWLAALWSPPIVEDLERALRVDGITRIRDFVARHSACGVDFHEGPPDPFFNVNTPEDLARAESFMGAP
ncbi:molybdenum cofactor guanylyltransferase MobA [Zavarzinia compransoris]|uniref:molybdenum cofactor guanylyltransferase MobA n=1 Tax=Zavarzinia marina TaxID=2911065 RepID=UPI001F16B675|nr:molybdenum cofactor guanylyltransferase MobA [Zavarzinia marina]MCF4166230.1 molybdenum cofactor guanylyltransferase MobA [Zavarzinia marina]